MPKIFLDSNVLVYYKDELSLFHKEVLSRLEEWMRSGTMFCISPLVLDEFLYVLKFRYKDKKKNEIFQSLKKAVKEILEVPFIELVNSPTGLKDQIKVVEYMEKYDLCPRDAYHLLTMIYNKIDSFATFDTDFNKVFEDKLIYSNIRNI